MVLSWPVQGDIRVSLERRSHQQRVGTVHAFARARLDCETPIRGARCPAAHEQGMAFRVRLLHGCGANCVLHDTTAVDEERQAPAPDAGMREEARSAVREVLFVSPSSTRRRSCPRAT